MRLKRLLYECECGEICKSIGEYAKHAATEVESKPAYGATEVTVEVEAPENPPAS